MTIESLMGKLTERFPSHSIPSMQVLEELSEECGGANELSDMLKTISPNNVTSVSGLVRWKLRQPKTETKPEAQSVAIDEGPLWEPVVRASFEAEAIQFVECSHEVLAKIQQAGCNPDYVEEDGVCKLLVNLDIMDEYAKGVSKSHWERLLARAYLAFSAHSSFQRGEAFCRISSAWRALWPELWNGGFRLRLGITEMLDVEVSV